MSILTCPLFLLAEPAVCLNMIVKDESAVIERGLNSVKHLIDYWVIVDTGSTDGTQTIIKECLKEIPGELLERPWKNFGYNREEALQLAKGKGEYLLFLDADDWFEYEESWQLPSLTKDAYKIWCGCDGFSYLLPQFIKNDLPWHWVGVTHEYLNCDRDYTFDILEKIRYITGFDGASSHDPDKFLKNIRLLEKGLEEDPSNARYVFYLAESYRDAGDIPNALKWYCNRIALGGWEEEVFWSYLQVSHLLKASNAPLDEIIENYNKAHRFRPHRVEPIYYLAELYCQNKHYELAYECIKSQQFISQPKQKDTLFNETWIDDYGLLFQLSICAYYVGEYQESLNACDTLLSNEKIPKHWYQQILENRIFPLQKIANQTY